MSTETLTLDDLTEEWPDESYTDIDRGEVRTTLQHHWWHDGYVVIPHLIEGDLIDAYKNEWINANHDRPEGWPYDVPYMHHPVLRELCCHPELASVLEEIIGEPMGVHLNLTGWVSTQRDWHADQYLNEPYVGGYYAAVWIALDDIHPDSGPFQYVDGSHRWQPVSQRRIREALGPLGEGPDWPRNSERILTPLYEQKIADEGLAVQSFTPKRGTVKIWHGRLLHRGSRPNVFGMGRRSLIAHFSGIHHRPDMPDPIRSEHGGWFFPIHQEPR